MRPPPEELRVEVTADAYHVELSRLPTPRSVLAIVVAAVFCAAMIALPILFAIEVPEEPSVMPPTIDADHLAIHMCEEGPLLELAPEKSKFCRASVPYPIWQLDHAGSNHMDELIRREGQLFARSAFQRQHARSVGHYRIAVRRWGAETAAYRSARTVEQGIDLVALLGIYLLFALGLRILQGLRPVTLIIHPERLIWGGRSIARADILWCRVAGSGLVVELRNGRLLDTGWTTQNSDALGWIANIIDQMVVSAAEQAEEAGMKDEVRSRHAAMVGRVKT